MADNWHNEDGFEFALHPAPSGKANALLVLFHGFGSNAKEWAPATEPLQALNPDADVIVLQAPEKVIHPDLPPGKEGFMWFKYDGGPFLGQVRLFLTHVFNRLPIIDKVNAFLDAQLDKRGLARSDLALIGHSMGAIVALQVGLQGKTPPAAVVSHSGAVLPFTKVRGRPPVLLLMGEHDPIFNQPPAPPQKGILKRAFAAAANALSFSHRASVRRLEDKHVPHEQFVIAGEDHNITRGGLLIGSGFVHVMLLLAKKLSSPGPAPELP